MERALKPALVLALSVSALSALILITGLHTNVMVQGVAFLGAVIGINVAVILWALRANAAHNGYGAQVGLSALIGLIAGVLIFAGSWLLLAVVFPDAIAETGEASLAALEQAGWSDEQLDEQAEAFERVTPVSQAVPGLIGTFVTSLVVGAFAAVFMRKK